MSKIETYQFGEAKIFLAPAMRISGDPKVEAEVMSKKRRASLMHNQDGARIPIGGAATEKNLRVVAAHIKDYTGLVIITSPTARPESAFEEYKGEFKSFGKDLDIFHLGTHTIPEEGNAMLRLSRRRGGAFITGGDQVRARDDLKDKGLDISLISFANEGNTVAGSSAGASIMSEVMPNGTEFTPGFKLVPGISVEQHNYQRDRKHRQQRVVEEKGMISSGFDEGTGGVIYTKTGRIDVFGSGGMNLVWQANGHQRDVRLRDGDWINLRALPSEHPLLINAA